MASSAAGTLRPRRVEYERRKAAASFSIFLFQDRIEGAAFDDGVGGAGVGAGGHDGDVCGFEEKEARGACAAAGGGDVDDDGDGGVFDGLDHDASGFEEAAGGSHGDEDSLGVEGAAVSRPRWR